MNSTQQSIADLGPWFHNLHLPDGTQTAPDHYLGDFPSYKWHKIAAFLPEHMEGWRVLDIGCNAGYYSLELAKRGAQVLGIDVDPRYLRQARWAAEQFGLQDRVEFRPMQVYDLAHLNETFDLVLFMGVFYHLRYPLLGLDIVSQKVKRLLVFQTLTMPGDEVYPAPYDMGIHHRGLFLEPGWPKMAFIEHRLMSDPTNWWSPNHSCVLSMLQSSGLRVLDCPEHETYLCEPDPSRPSSVSTWNAGEIISATGRLSGAPLSLNGNDRGASEEDSYTTPTPVFGLTKYQLLPILDTLVRGKSVTAFTLSFDHPVKGSYGYSAEKAVPTFHYTTRTGETGQVTLFAKRFYEVGPAEARYYGFLSLHGVPVARLYGSLTGHYQEEILFLEHLDPIGIDETSREEFERFMHLMARFNAVSVTEADRGQFPYHDLPAWLRGEACGHALDEIWSWAEKDDLDGEIARLCRENPQGPERLRALAERLAERIAPMPNGLVHGDFGLQNTGWRGEKEELVVFDLHKMRWGPRFTDAALWFGPPEGRHPMDALRPEMARYYLKELAQSGGPEVSPEELLEEAGVLWAAWVMEGLEWKLFKSLDGLVDWTDDPDEGKRVYRERLRLALTDLLNMAG